MFVVLVVPLSKLRVKNALHRRVFIGPHSICDDARTLVGQAQATLPWGTREAEMMILLPLLMLLLTFTMLVSFSSRPLPLSIVLHGSVITRPVGRL